MNGETSRNSRRRRAGTTRAVDDVATKKGEAKWWRLCAYLMLLGIDTIATILLLTPIVPPISDLENSSQSGYSLHTSLWDIAILAIPRLAAAVLTIALSYHRLDPPPESPFDLYKDNGEKKTKVELEEEALEEPFLPKMKRMVLRMPFICELSVFATGMLICAKCLARLNVEIGLFDEKRDRHPLFWLAIALAALFSLLESSYIDRMEGIAGELGCRRRAEYAGRRLSSSWMERISEGLAQPLLSRVNSEVDVENIGQSASPDETAMHRNAAEHIRGVSNIQSEAEYSANWSDLFQVCKADTHLIMLSSVFLLAAAVANVYVPKFTGEVLDALVAHQANVTAVVMGVSDAKSIVHIPGFLRNIELLLLVSILGGLFGGVRGAIFTVIGARVNVRLRIRLIDSLLSQDVGFFDTTRTGDITSRLSSDTTLVGSSLTTNCNIFLRSIVRAAGVLIFMFFISWQLSILAFVTVPTVSVLSKWYGRYVRRLTRLQQKKLAEGNSVSEDAMSAILTVRAFGAETLELAEFEDCMLKYLTLNKHASIATLGYSTCVNALPEIVKAVVLFYGGLLVQSDGPSHITGGQLVSFILYLSSLSQSFNSLGGVYASLVRAVGAADKVFELMNREPQYTQPSRNEPGRVEQALERKQKHLLGVESTKIVTQRAEGLYPQTCTGDITFRDVNFTYPARPQRVVLDQLNLRIPAGSIVALVGSSGSGKSSIVKLIAHLYEQGSGSVMVDDNQVFELSPEYLTRWISIVPQEPTLMARTVKRNIIYGLEGTDAEPSQQEIEEAVRLANAATFVDALPQKYDTEVGERGIRLSGGQKQRIAIARAIVRKPRILLLDEATSALDAESEHVVQEAIDSMISGQRSLDGDPSRSMTVVIVAHRLSTIRNADRIFVIENGRVAEQGSHNELVENPDGVYSKLIRRQLGSNSESSASLTGLAKVTEKANKGS